MNSYQVQTLQLRQTLQLSILKQKNANFTQTFQLSTNKQRIPITLHNQHGKRTVNHCSSIENSYLLYRLQK